MFFYMRRSSDLEAYISSCKFRCLFAFTMPTPSPSPSPSPSSSSSSRYVPNHHQKRLENPANSFIQSGKSTESTHPIPTHPKLCHFFSPAMSGADFQERLGTLPAGPGGLSRQPRGAPGAGWGVPCLAEVSPLLQATLGVFRNVARECYVPVVFYILYIYIYICILYIIYI